MKRARFQLPYHAGLGRGAWTRFPRQLHCLGNPILGSHPPHLRNAESRTFTVGVTGFASGLLAVAGSSHSRESVDCSEQDRPAEFGVHALPADVDAGLRNCSDSLARCMPEGSKLIWLFRHGQSTSNVALEGALEGDRRLKQADGYGEHFLRYKNDCTHTDSPLTSKGEAQALEAAAEISAWNIRPELVVCSPLTRSIQTAAIMFAEDISSGRARLVIRPELREFFADFQDARGRPLSRLQQCPRLQALAPWPMVAEALSDEATAEWREAWNEAWACGPGGAWQEHCNSGERLGAFTAWLSGRPEERIAVVSHWGTINNFLNRQPWTQNRERKELPWPHERSAWPPGGLVRMFDVPNCGWIAVEMSSVEASSK
mmetsp:Transcript_17/g.55  ORF Transcript_17/g.55 Transcript_17/m.55 type:complete len:373 (-) Transcript_17:99-1217(-)